MNLGQFLSEHFPLIAKIVGGIFVLMVARKPAIDLIKTLLERRTVQMEVSTFEILRGEIKALNQLLSEYRKKNEGLELEITELRKEIHQLTQALNNPK